MNTQKSIQELEESYQFRMSLISHEIRNPVNLISNYLQLLAKRHPEVTGFTYWDEVISNTDFLIDLLNEITAYNNSENVRLESKNIYMYVRDFVETISPELEQKNIHILLKKESALPRLDIDAIKFRQILHNLVRNSAEAIESDGTIIIRMYFDDLSIVIELSDDGPGIPDEYLSTLFDPFVTHKKDGTGLGLAITKNIVEAHGGTIQVNSYEGKGTSFSMRFPL